MKMMLIATSHGRHILTLCLPNPPPLSEEEEDEKEEEEGLGLVEVNAIKSNYHHITLAFSAWRRWQGRLCAASSRLQRRTPPFGQPHEEQSFQQASAGVHVPDPGAATAEHVKTLCKDSS